MWTLNTTPKHSVHVTLTDERYDCHSNESLLKGMLRLGRKGIPVGCVNGGCGICKVRIVEGSVSLLGPVSRAHVSAEEEADGYTLACRVAPTEAVCLEVSALLARPFSKSCKDDNKIVSRKADARPASASSTDSANQSSTT